MKQKEKGDVVVASLFFLLCFCASVVSEMLCFCLYGAFTAVPAKVIPDSLGFLSCAKFRVPDICCSPALAAVSPCSLFFLFPLLFSPFLLLLCRSPTSSMRRMRQRRGGATVQKRRRRQEGRRHPSIRTLLHQKGRGRRSCMVQPRLRILLSSCRFH